MKNAIQKEWEKVLRQEQRFLHASRKKSPEWAQTMGTKIEEKIPDIVVEKLQQAFDKAFYVVFEKGEAIVEKTFSKENLHLEFEVNDYRVEKSPTRRSLRKVEGLSKKGNLRNLCLTTVEGVGLGVVGVGLPDIPLFLAVLMKGLYEMAASYGYDYSEERERVFLLRLIQAALAEEDMRVATDQAVEQCMNEPQMSYIFTDEISKTAKTLSITMLVAKFIQGLPLVGVAGGIVNPIIYQKVQKYAALKYKKRYLKQRMRIRLEES